MTVREMLTLIFSCTLFFGTLGTAIGYTIGRFLPDYYRSVFRAARTESFDPLAIGIGQGVTQGVTAGAAVGLVLVVVLAWYRAKTFSVQRVD